jgi:hypothetical protein
MQTAAEVLMLIRVATTTVMIQRTGLLDLSSLSGWNNPRDEHFF